MIMELVGWTVVLAAVSSALFYVNARHLGNSAVLCVLACIIGGPLVWAMVLVFTVANMRKPPEPPAPKPPPLEWHYRAYNLLVAIYTDNQRVNGQTALRAEDEARLAELVTEGREVLFVANKPD